MDPAPIVLAGASGDQAFLLEAVDGPGDAGGGDPLALGQVGRRQRSPLVEGGEDRLLRQRHLARGLLPKGPGQSRDCHSEAGGQLGIGDLGDGDLPLFGSDVGNS